MTEPNNCVLLPSIDCLPLTQLYVNFFQEQEEKAKLSFGSLDSLNVDLKNCHVSSPKQQLSPPLNLNIITPETNIQLSSVPDKKKNQHFDFKKNMTVKLKGSWSPDEDNKLREAVANCDPILWDIVAEHVPGRSAIQCKERWLYRLHPEVKKTRFEKWEDDLIISERNKVGNHWTLISNKLPGRTSCAVKNRWYSVLRNRLMPNDSFSF